MWPPLYNRFISMFLSSWVFVLFVIEIADIPKYLFNTSYFVNNDVTVFATEFALCYYKTALVIYLLNKLILASASLCALLALTLASFSADSSSSSVLLSILACNWPSYIVAWAYKSRLAALYNSSSGLILTPTRSGTKSMK